MLNKHENKIFLLLLMPVVATAILGYLFFNYYQLNAAYLKEKEKLSKLIRRNRQLEDEISKANQRLKEALKKRNKITKIINSYNSITSPQDAIRAITIISVKNKLQIVKTSSLEEGYKLRNFVFLRGEERNLLKALEDILKTFPMKVENISLFRESSNVLQLSWTSPLIKKENFK